jgi:CheY-like chemotaxis protein/anti-sigma regulatory factor (Ser/Thr protein kinase)
MSLTVVVTEIFVMNLLPIIFPTRSFDWVTNIVDGVLISALVAPSLWIFLVSPLVNYADRSNFFSKVSHELSTSLDYQQTLKRLALLPIPVFADWCLVHLLDQDKNVPIVAAGHSDRVLAEKLISVQTKERSLADEPKVPNLSLLTEKTIIWSAASENMVKDHHGLSPEGCEILLNAGVHSCICSPLKARGKVFGTVTLMFSRPSRTYSEFDINFIENFASRISLGIDNALLYSTCIDVNKGKDTFLAILSHELRTPLNVIQGWSHILKSEGLGTANFDQVMDTIERNINLLERLINDLLDVSRIIAGRLSIESSVINLNELLDSSAQSGTALAMSKRVELVTRFDKDLGFIKGDFSYLQRMIVNLLSNGIKFTPAGGRVILEAKMEQEKVLICVRDTGMGIEPGFIPHIFDLFSQENGARSRSYGGLGLGLPISKAIAEQHNGNIRVFSAGKGKGAEFQVRIPLLPRDTVLLSETSRSSKPDSTISGPKPLEGLRVLVVDDAKDMLLILKAFLVSSGAVVTAVSSAEEAFDRIKGERPDILLSDISMPDEDGYSLIQRVRKLAPIEGGETPAIALTGYAHAEERAKTLKSGFQAHLPKPIKKDALTSKILQVLMIPAAEAGAELSAIG